MKTLATYLLLFSVAVCTMQTANAQPAHPIDSLKYGGVLGRVFLDNDGDGHWSKGDEGLADVLLHTDTGEEVITGPDGRYHLTILLSGFEINSGHLLKLDTSTLPYGVTVPGSARRFGSKG